MSKTTTVACTLRPPFLCTHSTIETVASSNVQFKRAARTMHFRLVLFSVLLFGWINIALILLLVNIVLTYFNKRMFARFCANMTEKYNEICDSVKEELFKDLNDHKKDEKICILEVGAGSGANFKYYNRNATVQSIEPNLYFSKYFEENRAKFPHLDIKEIKKGFGENLSSAGITDESVDVAVMTLVLCSVEDQERCLAEIKRVLKPGGKFIFLEHIIGDVGSSTRTLQKILMTGGFWPFLYDNCCVDRQTDKAIEEAGFSKLELKKIELKKLGPILKPHVMGIATK